MRDEPAPDARAAVQHANARRADDVVQALLRHGVQHVFVCPGSRSTPLVLALERADVAYHVLLDERVAGFAALGAARAHAPAAVVTTSGTAVANLLPALCEAGVDEIGWVAVTADRPRRLVGRGANQTLDQPPLLAGAVRTTVDLDAPGEAPAGADVDARAEFDAALAHLVGRSPGPVHLNIRFTKPLEPAADYRSAPRAPTADLARTATSADALHDVIGCVASAARGVVVCAGLPLPERAAAEALVEALGWPAIVDASSGLARSGAHAARLSPGVLRSAAARAALTPDVILWLGNRTVEDQVPTWARGCGARVVQVRFGSAIRDPFDVIAHSAVSSCAALLSRLNASRRAQPAHPLAAVASKLMAAARRCADDASTPTPLTEPAVAALVSDSNVHQGTFVVGSSMPIRDVDRFSQTLPAQLIVNRGASGIDGTFGTALGAALATGTPCTVLLGDLTALHDLSGLAALARSKAAVRIVVINNDGGGIFSFLPVASSFSETSPPDAFERAFGTPHGLSLAPVAQALGIPAVKVESRAEFDAALAAPVVGPRLIEVVTDRTANVATHRALDARLERAVAEELARPAPRVVFLHGSYGNARDWDAVRASLSVPSVALDLPAHGNALHAPATAVSAGATDAVWDATVAGLAAQIGQHTSEPVVLVGYSLGARLAAAVAAAHPNQVAALVLEGGHLGLLDDTQRQERRTRDDARAAALVADPARFLKTFWQDPLFAGQSELDGIDAQLARRVREAQRLPSVLADVMRGLSLGRMPVVALPAALPVEWITGEHDATYGDVARAHCRTSASAHHTVVAGAGHNAHAHSPRAVAAVVARAIERTGARATGGLQ